METEGVRDLRSAMDVGDISDYVINRGDGFSIPLALQKFFHRMKMIHFESIIILFNMNFV